MYHTTTEAHRSVIISGQWSGERAPRSSGTKPATMKSRRMGLIAALLSEALILAACGATTDPVASPVSEEQAIEMAENALQGFNERDYATWSRDWSDTMKSAIDENGFLSFRDQFHGQLGNYTQLTGVSGSQGADQGTYRWTYDIQFENGAYRMWFGFKEGSTLIEGVSFEDPKA